MKFDFGCRLRPQTVLEELTSLPSALSLGNLGSEKEGMEIEMGRKRGRDRQKRKGRTGRVWRQRRREGRKGPSRNNNVSVFLICCATPGTPRVYRHRTALARLWDHLCPRLANDQENYRRKQLSTMNVGWTNLVMSIHNGCIVLRPTLTEKPTKNVSFYLNYWLKLTYLVVNCVNVHANHDAFG